MANRRGAAMGAEFKRKGVNVLLGPVVGPAWRVTLSGRNWESFSADPYLSGSLAAQSIVGIQGQGVITSTKVSQRLKLALTVSWIVTPLLPSDFKYLLLQHFIANEQETNRNPNGNVQSVSSNIDDKTMHELYLW